MKDQHIDLDHLEVQWTRIVQELLHRRGYRTETDAVVREDQRADILAEQEQDQILVEVRLHRSERIPMALLRNAVEQLRIMISGKRARGLLVLSQPLSMPQADRLMLPHNVEVWDLTRLIEEAKEHVDLTETIAHLLRIQKIGAEKVPSEPEAQARLEEALVDTPPAGAGATLAAQILAIKPGRGRPSAVAFESRCTEALKLLYGADFLGWRSQSGIDEGFQRIDLIGRLVPTLNSFWATLASDFRTRYVVFEFKNYSKKITQDQVYTTEKYLFTGALRSVAVIVARNGKGDSADRAIRGALREQGKLMLCISMAEFCQLLREFDEGKDPTNLLVQRLDELLMSIAR